MVDVAVVVLSSWLAKLGHLNCECVCVCFVRIFFQPSWRLLHVAQHANINNSNSNSNNSSSNNFV